jgi:glycosyltransferase involved in cell wall biosynthesis
MDPVTLHILSNPCGITDLRYRMDPFNVAICKMIDYMQSYGYQVYHYGHESSQVSCDNIPTIYNHELPPINDDQMFQRDERFVQLFNRRASDALAKLKRPRDLVLVFWGTSQQETVANHTNLFVVEPSIGYRTECVFAPYRAFTSYSQMHYYYGQRNMLCSPSWYDTVIPNAFTVSEFQYRPSSEKEDFVLYLGRIAQDKGIDICIQATEKLGKRLVIAGPGSLRSLGYTTTPNHVECVGYVNAQQRKDWLSRARVLMAPTYYLEPFGNIVVEAMLSGTPVITTDWGGFAETNLHGVTGYRCKDFRSFMTAIQQIDRIDSSTCRSHAETHYADEVVHPQFDTYFQRILRQDFYA